MIFFELTNYNSEEGGDEVVWQDQSIVKIHQIYFDNIDVELIDNFVQNPNVFIYRFN